MSHWSDLVTWRAGRWDPMSNAPLDQPIRVRYDTGAVYEPVSFRNGSWAKPRGRGLSPDEWQPLRARQAEEKPLDWPFPISNPEHGAWIAAQIALARARNEATR